jgi:hypothetical protein
MLIGRIAALSINVKHKVDQLLSQSTRCLLTRALERGTNMPRFYFHLSAPDEEFPDNVGSDVSDLAGAHSRAVLLAKRVTIFSRFADRALDLRRWTVKVTDERRRAVFTVIFPTNSVPPVIGGGARALLKRLEAIDPQRGNNGAVKLLPAPTTSRTNSMHRRQIWPARYWSAESTDACYLVRDHNGQALSCACFEDEPGHLRGAMARAIPPPSGS